MHSRPLTTAIALGCLAIAGCRATAPMNVWAPPKLQSAVSRTVVMASIVGDRATARRLQEAIFAARPPELARQVRLIDQAELQRHSEIQLASATENMPSDVALLAEARKRGLDFLLLGEILERRDAAVNRPLSAGNDSLPPTAAPRAQLTVSWRLIDVGEAQLAGGTPVTVTMESAAELHPDLAILELDTEGLLATAAARETWRLLAPHVQRVPVGLAKPLLARGSEAVRRGNVHAAALRWDEAERLWQAVSDRHPRNHAALHNLALAAAARQDFDRAKSLAQQALRLHRSRAYEHTVVWIETRHREMVAAFDLPPPEEGWLFAPDEVPQTAETPAAPPRWSWWAWLTQPIPLP